MLSSAGSWSEPVTRFLRDGAGRAQPPKVVTSISVGVFNHIEGITVAADGIVWIADTDNNRVVSYNPTNGAVAGTVPKDRVFTVKACSLTSRYPHDRCGSFRWYLRAAQGHGLHISRHGAVVD
jgi:hypothetical protein